METAVYIDMNKRGMANFYVKSEYAKNYFLEDLKCNFPLIKQILVRYQGRESVSNTQNLFVINLYSGLNAQKET